MVFIFTFPFVCENADTVIFYRHLHVIQSVKHIDGEPDGSGKAEKEKTKITLSRTIAAGSEAIKIANTPSVYDTLGMTEEELEAIKADLQQ